MSTLDKIIYLLKLRGMSDSELARQIGIGRSAVTDWKNGKTASYKKHIVSIAKALDVTPEYLLDETVTLYTPTSEQIDNFTKESDDLTPEERSKVEEYIKFIKSQRGN